MKIIRAKEEVDYYKSLEKEACKECDICPCCSSRLVSRSWTTFYKGLLPRKLYKMFRCKCLECGTLWESEPFEIPKQITW